MIESINHKNNQKATIKHNDNTYIRIIMLITNKHELLRHIDNLFRFNNHKEITQITFLCPNLHEKLLYTTNKNANNLLEEIINKFMSANANNKTIYSFMELDEKQIFNKSNESKFENFQFISYYNNNNNNAFNAILDLIKQSANLTKDYHNLNDMLDDIDIDNVKQLSLANCKQTIIEQIENIIVESDLFSTTMSDNAKKYIEQTLNTLEMYIKQAIEERHNANLKNIINTLFGVVVALVTGGGIAIVLLGISAALFSSLVDYQHLQDNKYNYIKNPIIEFLATELAIYIQLTNTRLLSCMLIVESKEQKQNAQQESNIEQKQNTEREQESNTDIKQESNKEKKQEKTKIEFIDLSGFNLYTSDTLLLCSQSIAFKGEFMLDSPMLDIPSLLHKQAIALPTIQHNHNNINAQMLHIYQNTTKQQNIKDSSLLTSILQEVQRLNHLIYLESPYFNSALLAEIFNNKNTQYPNHHTTNMTKNYLIITNAPSKYNAKLTETITQHIIGNTIKDDINNRTRQDITITNTNNNNKSSYNPTRDYSTYRIEIDKKDDEPYMVQLSVFVRVDDKVYNSAQMSKEEIEYYSNIAFSNNGAGIGYDSYRDMQKKKEASQAYQYIESFFKTPKEIGDIITHEKQIAHDFLYQLQQFHNSNTNLDSLLALFSLFYGLSIFTIHFPNFTLKSSIETKPTSPQYLNISCLNETWRFIIVHSQSQYHIEIIKDLQEKLSQNITQEINLTQEFLQYLKEFMDTDNTNENIQVLDNEMKEYIWRDIDKEIEKEQEQIKNYGKKYIEIVKKERTQEIFYTSMLKILGAICPFMNFIHENMIDTTKHCIAIFINTLHNLSKTNKIPQLTLYNTLLTEIGVFSYCFNPAIMRVHIEVNEDVNKQEYTSQTTKQESLHNKQEYTSNIQSKIKAKLAKLLTSNNKESFFKDFARMELRHTKAQMAHFEAKTAFILDTIDNNAKQLKLVAIKEKLKQTMNTHKDRELIDKIFFTYGSGKAQSYFIGEIQAQIIFQQVKQFYHSKIFYTFKSNLYVAVLSIALNAVLEHYFSTHYEEYQREYKSIMHKRYIFYYDLPYALKRDENILENLDNKIIEKTMKFIYYPMLIYSKFISCDLQSMIYGTELCTGGLTHHIGLAYLLKQHKSDILQEYLLKKILSYIIIDEKRNAKSRDDIELCYDKQIPDFMWFNNTHISLDNIRKYQVPKDSSLYEKFKVLENGKYSTSAIDAYNDALNILADYKEYYFTNTRELDSVGRVLCYKEDKNKARRLLQCLNTIGQNNIKALYVGTSEKSRTMKRPRFIGRLATTIIIEDGLWLG